MTILIGVDEAGYGPNLGPLAVAATAWYVDEQGGSIKHPASNVEKRAAATRAATLASPARPADAVVDLYRRLAKAVSPAPAKRGRRVAIADSKRLYTPGLGVRLLELGVLGAHGAIEARRRCLETPPADSVESLIAATQADPHRRSQELPWHADADECLPVAATAEEIARAANLLANVGDAAGARPVAIWARLIHPAEFNDLVGRFGTKGGALSHVTLELIRRMIDAVIGDDGCGRSECKAPPPAPAATAGRCQITFDKHGGRNHYAALVQHHFPESWIDVAHESRAVSVYCWQHRGVDIEGRFRVGGEAELPTALASMTAKYLRELMMRQFNAYWTARVCGLTPTAGYPRDARRFKSAIADEQRQLGIDDRMLWRSR